MATSVPPETALIGPAVIAACISSVVAMVGFFVSTWNAKRLSRERLDADHRLAKRKIKADIALADRRLNADLELAEKKFILDEAFAARKRKTEFAEEILADIYRLRTIFEVARSPSGVWFKASIKRETDETDAIARYRTAIYWPIDHLTSSETNEFLAQLASRRLRFATYFGPEGDKPFLELEAIQAEIFDAALNLVKNYRDIPLQEPPEKATWERTIGLVRQTAGEDAITSRLETAIANIENFCRPYLAQEVGE
jgi:hypothetical protein